MLKIHKKKNARDIVLYNFKTINCRYDYTCVILSNYLLCIIIYIYIIVVVYITRNVRT